MFGLLLVSCLKVAASGSERYMPNEQSDESLKEAVRFENIPAVARILTTYNYADQNRAKPLFNESVESVEDLLEYTISHRKNPMIIELLLKKGWDANALGYTENTYLSTAVRSGNIAAAKILLAYEANPNGLGRNGWAPLHNAVQAENVAIMDLLLKNGADPNIRLNRSREDARIGEIGEILKGATPLQMLATKVIKNSYANEQCFDVLIEYGADVREKNWIGYTILHVLAACDNVNWPKFMQIALDAGVDPNAQSYDSQDGMFNGVGYTALHLLAKSYEKNRLKIAIALINAGADPQIKDNVGRTPLQMLSHHNPDKKELKQLFETV